MFKNYLKVAFRNLWRNKSFSTINIIGLSLGLTCSFLILLWVNDEKSVDSFLPNRTTRYNIIQRAYADNKKGIGYLTPGLLGEEMKRTLPEVMYAVNYTNWGNVGNFRVGDKVLKENGEYAGEDFFKVFPFPLVLGEPGTALHSVSDIAISKKMAQDLFGSESAAIGKTIRFENKDNFTVSAVFSDLPVNSSQQFDYLINWAYLKRENSWVQDWNSVSPYTTVVLRADANPEQFRGRIRHFLDNLNTKQGPHYRVELDMQRSDEMYLNGAFKNKEIGGGRIEYVRMFSMIAIFILLIACINFMNLTTARSLKRAKEIGVRKTAGAMKGMLIWQFMGEAILFVLLAVIISIGLVLLLLPLFNDISGKNMHLPFSSGGFWLQLVIITLLTGLIAGSYPAFFLSSFNPVKVLKGSIKFSPGVVLFRKGLVVFQFVLSCLLIIATLIISQQVKFIQAVNLGFDRENLISIPMEGALVNQYTLFRQEALRMPGIQEVTQLSQAPSQSENYWVIDVDWDGRNIQERAAFAVIYAGYDLTQTMHLKMKEGRDFSRDFARDSAGYLLNESALAKTGLKDPIGKSFSCLGKIGTIVGIVKDFHFNSLHEAIAPLIIAFDPSQGSSILVRTAAGKTSQAIASLEKECKQLNPNFPFTYQFSDEAYRKLYRNEDITGKLSYLFAFLAISISCLGLLGLAIFTAEQRGKEIAIRKVLGANVVQLFTLLSRDFFTLVLISFTISVPFAWWIMSKWLEDYAYRTEISWWMFVVAGGAALVITFLTVSMHVLKATLVPPTKSLKSQ